MKGSIKQSKKLLMEFSDISDEELKVLTQKTIYDYEKSKKMEQMILDIIYDLGYSKILPINHELENKYKKITQLAQLRKIKLSKNIEMNITTEDLINELHEISNRETKWIEEHSYLYDCYYDGLENDNIDVDKKKASLEVINEVSNFYQKVILEITPKQKAKVR